MHFDPRPGGSVRCSPLAWPQRIRIALHEVLLIMVFKVIENNPDLIICVQTCGSLNRSETKWVVQ